MTVFPKWYVRGPLLSLSTIVLPGEYSVIVPLPSVVVVVVVVSDTCAHAKGATTARAILSNVFFIYCFLCFSAGPILLLTSFPRTRKCAPPVYDVIGRRPSSGCQKNPDLLSSRGAVSYPVYPGFQVQNRHEVHDSIGWNFCLQRSAQAKLNEFQLPRMMSISAE